MKITIRQPKCFSEIGRKDNQEDFLWPNPQTVTKENRVFVMCDGVGGQDSGEVASETAATALGTFLTGHLPEDGVVTKAFFEEALSYAYDEMDKVDTGAVKKMGTTMTCLVLHKGGALVAHIGDSRIYHIRPSLASKEGRTGIIYQSADHSLVNDLLRAGEITEEEAVNFPQKNVITRAMQPHLERRYKADVYEISDVESGDYFFLCCDGVLEQLTNDRLGEILADETLDDEGKIAAIKAVCDGNTRDNYTCWLVPIDEVEREEEENTSEEENIAVVVEQEEQEPEMQMNDETTPPVPEPEREENTSLIGMFVSLIKKLIGKKDGEQ
jgi:serine/threonine protein phosphatase PrpC